MDSLQEDKIEFPRVIYGSLLQLILRLMLSTVFYLIGGLWGLIASVIVGHRSAMRARLAAFPKYTTAVTYVASGMHVVSLVYLYGYLNLKMAPFWWPL